MAMRDKLTQGFSMDGELPPTGFWKHVSEKKMEEMRAEMEATNTERSRTAPDRAHWASEEDLEELWRQRESMIESGRWHEGDVSRIGRVGGAVAFPVHQGGKVRVCIDLRSQNTQVLVTEVIRLLNARATAQIIGKLMANNFRQPQFFQFKSDIKADIEEEKVLRACLEENDRALQESAKIASAAPEPDPDSETEFAFTPTSQKRDMRQFYYQLGVADPCSNAIWFQKPAFGTRHSSTEIGPPPPKRAKLAKQKPEWFLTFSDCTAFGARTCMETDLLSYKGLYRHCTQLDRTKSYLARALDFWVGENFTRNIVRTKERRQLLTSVQTMQRAATKVKPLSLSPGTVNAPIAHVYTDAAADDLPALNELLKKGVRKGFERFNLKIGGFLQLPSGVTKSFSMQIKELPGEVDSMSIGVLEAAAARLAMDFFKTELKGCFTILHVDNMGDVYCLSRNASKSFLIQSVCSQFHRVLMDFDLQVYVTWICTSRNVADVLTRSERTQLLKQHFPNCLHSELPHALALSLCFWGLGQKDYEQASCWW
eukprot:g5137.t1